MDVKDVGAKFLQELQIGGAVVDEGTALGRWQNLTSQDKRIVIVGIVTGEERFQSQPSYIKGCLHHTLAFLVGQHLCVGTLSEQQSCCTQQDRFARTCLASDDHKALVEGDVSLPYQRVILNM